jgi:glycosyltransferase involved in cell wall biosynthesis
MKQKRILLVSQYFYPENFKCNDIAFELSRRGYKVDVLTNIPNYPIGSYLKGYGLFRKRKETINGVRIFRSLVIPRKKGSFFRILNYFSFMCIASFNALILSIFNKYDCVFVMQTSPIMQAYPGIVVKKLQRIPLYMWILDIWPDSMISGGNIKNEHIIKAVTSIVRNVYNNCDKLLISSLKFKELVKLQGVNEEKIIYFPNWSDDILNMPKKEITFTFPEGFNIVMAGTLGGAQCLDSVISLIKELRNIDNLNWIFVGDGKKREWFEKEIKKEKLNDNVYILGQYSPEYMPTFFSKADAMLLTLKANWPHLSAVVPARVQSYMAAGKPILGMVDGGAHDLIKSFDCGYVVAANAYKDLASVIKDIILSDKKSFLTKGENGRIAFEHFFTKYICITKLEDILK